MGIRAGVSNWVLGISITDQTSGDIYEDALPRQEGTGDQVVYACNGGDGCRVCAYRGVPAHLAGLRGRPVCVAGRRKGGYSRNDSGNGGERFGARGTTRSSREHSAATA